MEKFRNSSDPEFSILYGKFTRSFGITRLSRVHKYTYIHGYFHLYFFPLIRRTRIRGNRKLNRNAIISIHRPISHSDPIDLEKSTREFNAEHELERYFSQIRSPVNSVVFQLTSPPSRETWRALESRIKL